MANKNNNMENTNEQEDKSIIDNSELEDERIKTRKLQAFGVIAFAVVILVLGAITLLGKFKGDSNDKKEANIGTSVRKGDFSVKDEPQKLKEIVLPATEPNTTIQPNQNNDPFTPTPAKEKNTVVIEFKPQVYKSSSSLLVPNTSNTASTANMNIGNSEINEDGERVFKTVSGEYVFDKDGNFVRRNDEKPSLLGGSGIGGSTGEYENGVFTPKSAKIGSFDPNLYLSKGTYIGCSLDTKLVSTIKGGISCTVSENVYSTNGVTLLIEKGSKITGYFNSGQMNDGMDRIFVVWNEIRTPNNIIIPVSSGASDELGGTGIPGYVDHHWLERFGASILLSVIDDALNVALNGRSGSRRNSNVDYTENTRETTRQMANTALEKFINIQPTLYKNHGDLVGVYVNRDIDFSKVYKLKVRKK
ncbi:type IV secretion system protein VirB10 (plasmid) [Campylobacter fetus]|uniref:Type IV secretion system protein VirB10 n=1 Tax=Campylobacter fetus TaxID=196 RepID=A0A974MU84_CAMFE|nr:type IV secretion system protein VirB10 [Campylobacter fetus]OCS32897.1 hypothetical protein AWR31_08135 [Campylobacter fetus subsp. venerealis]QMS59900.1 type IV secretion system protein VirB10 [Campylobacter fetus]